MGTRSEGEEALSRACLGHPRWAQPHQGPPEEGSLYPEGTRAGEGLVCGAGEPLDGRGQGWQLGDQVGPCSVEFLGWVLWGNSLEYFGPTLPELGT